MARWVSDSHPLTAVMSGVFGVCLIMGAFTPAVCLVATALQLWEEAQHGWPAWPFALLLIAVFLALAVLGPGAFSVDGWLFGRKKITIGRLRS
jgi:uncharacterized membrane protein YphA (DoxX/SURF4 family)